MSLLNVTKKAAKWLVAELPSKAFDQALAPASAREQRLIVDFRRNMARCSAAVRDSADIADHWKESVQNFERAVRERDPREFLRWEESLSLRAGPGVFPQYLWLRKSPRWSSRWAPSLKEAPFGHPLPFFLHPKVGANIILHAYHIERIEEFTGQSIKEYDVIVEFGGGYGGLCRLAHTQGFKGKYFIFDLPQQSVLQEFYLKGAGIPVVPEGEGSHGRAGAYLHSDLESFAPRFDEVRKATKGRILFVANWSLSETPLSLRDKINPAIVDKCDDVLITYQEFFTEVDNVAYFEAWRAARKEGFDFHVSKMPLRKPADYYMMGKRR